MSIEIVSFAAIAAAATSIVSLILPLIKEFAQSLHVKKPNSIVIRVKGEDGEEREIKVSLTHRKEGLSEDVIEELLLKIGEGTTIKLGDDKNGNKNISS